MLKQLLINASFLIAFVSMANVFFHEKLLTKTSPLVRVLYGLTFGVLGILLMNFSVPVGAGIIIDYRNLAVIISAIYGSSLSAMTTVLILAVYRALYNGLSMASITVSISILILGLLCIYIARLRISRAQKWILTVLGTSTISSIAIMLFVVDPRFLLTFWVGTILVSVFAYTISERLELSSQEFIQYRKEAHVDYLTGLGNRRFFQRRLGAAVENAENEPFSLLMLDIDFFKAINDTYGHSEGDRILTELAGVFRKTCRSFDILSRYGGEEFAILLLDTSPEKAVLIAERIRSAVEQHPFLISTGSLHITISIGVAYYTPDSNPDDLLLRADQALYRAKKTGRNRVQLAA